MITAHTDWPSFLIKPQPELTQGSYGKLNIEPYGGAVYTSWLDRPLGIAGKVCTKGKDAFHPVTHLIDSKKPVAVIPGLAIHMNPEINKGIQLNPQLQLLPLVARLGEDENPIISCTIWSCSQAARQKTFWTMSCFYTMRIPVQKSG